VSLGGHLLRLRSDEQLVALFREGNDEAFRVIHDRYHQRLFAYTRQMLPGSRQDAEDALQDVFVRAYGGLRANDRSLALRAWLYRVAHNRCIDELRRPEPPAPEVLELVQPPAIDPIAEAEQRESLRRLIADVRRLPEQQRAALLMRELGGMTYNDIAAAMDVSVPAIKSLLVRARVGLAQAAEARDTSCAEIREELICAHDRGVRPTGLARRHLRECAGCSEFRTELRGNSRQLAALVPAFGPVAAIAKLLGFGGGGFGFGSSGGAAGGAAAVGTGGTAASVGVLATGAGHVATLLAAAVVTAGGAVEIQHTIAQRSHHRATHHARAAAGPTRAGAPQSVGVAVAHTGGPVTAAPASASSSSLAPEPASTARPHRSAGDFKSQPVTPPVSSPAPGTSSTGATGPVPVSGTPGDATGTTGTGSLPGDGTLPGGTTTPGTGSNGTTPGVTPPDAGTGTVTTATGPTTPTGTDGSTGSTSGTTTPVGATAGADGSTSAGGSPVSS
jgi:RNA polymerase sigma factor (sigma-70 family)